VERDVPADDDVRAPQPGHDKRGGRD
jgi:hypothetical protein